MNDFPWRSLFLGLIGATVGAFAGYFGYKWGLSQGFDAAVAPGALLGFGFALAARSPRLEFGILCAVLALLFSLYVEWTFWPFVKDDSLGYFLTHLHELKPLKLLMILAGVYLAFSIGKGREST